MRDADRLEQELVVARGEIQVLSSEVSRLLGEGAKKVLDDKKAEVTKLSQALAASERKVSELKSLVGMYEVGAAASTRAKVKAEVRLRPRAKTRAKAGVAARVAKATSTRKK